MNVFIALLKREILEHKNIWKVPAILLIIAILIRLSLLFGNFSIDVNMPEQINLDEWQSSLVNSALARAFSFMGGIIMVSMLIVSIFYALSCLYNERVDESVLFWRSLPVSDFLTVASKLTVALIIIPLVIVVCISLAAVIFLGPNSLQLLGDYYAQMLPRLFSIVAWSMIPVISWCIFCSEIAKKNPFLLAFLAPIIFVVVDKLFLNGAISQYMVLNRLNGFADPTFISLIEGVLLSAVFLTLATLKRSQRF